MWAPDLQVKFYPENVVREPYLSLIADHADQIFAETSNADQLVLKTHLVAHEIVSARTQYCSMAQWEVEA